MVVALAAGGADPSLAAVIGSELRSPADVAAAAGHPGIAAFLSECSLNSSLSSMSLGDQQSVSADSQLRAAAAEAGDRAVAQAAATAATSGTTGGAVHTVTRSGVGLMGAGADDMDETLAAIRRTAQAAAIIQGAFRKHVIRAKEKAGAHSGPSDAVISSMENREESGKRAMEPADLLAAAGVPEEALRKALAGRRTHRSSHGSKEDGLNRAATLVQSRFRAWKKRSEFVRLKKNVIKIQVRMQWLSAGGQCVVLHCSIRVGNEFHVTEVKSFSSVVQAHVKGHIQRKQYKKMKMSLRVLARALLSWKKRRPAGTQLSEQRGEPQDSQVTGVHQAMSHMQSMASSEGGRAQYARMRQAQTGWNGDELDAGF